MAMTDPASIKATVHGFVQGVYFRAFVSAKAKELGLNGYVCNLPDGNVAIHAEGERRQLEILIDYLKVGPPAAIVERVETEWSEYTGNYSRFNIRY
jgi:acylphosphatase